MKIKLVKLKSALYVTSQTTLRLNNTHYMLQKINTRCLQNILNFIFIFLFI